MKKRILNAVGWMFLFAASILSTGAFIEYDNTVFILIFLFATAAIPFFWFGGCNSRRCRPMKFDG